MAYIEDNPKSKAEVKRWLAAGRTVRIKNNSPFVDNEKGYTGKVSVEGPHYPKAHTWWGTANVVDGIVKEIS